jgi:hypothetical protein
MIYQLINLFKCIAILGHIKKNSWLASLAFGKKWAGGRFFFKFLLIFNALVLGPKRDFLAQYRYFLYISKYDSYRHFRTQFRNLLTQLTTVNRNTTYIRAP